MYANLRSQASLHTNSAGAEDGPSIPRNHGEGARSPITAALNSDAKRNAVEGVPHERVAPPCIPNLRSAAKLSAQPTAVSLHFAETNSPNGGG